MGALIDGFATALTFANLGWCVLGVTLGTAIGILPGIGPALTIALLLPLTGHLDPTGAFIMFAGLYYGAMYGSSTTSILLNTPGETGSIITAVEGNLMARQRPRRGGARHRGHRVLCRRHDRYRLVDRRRAPHGEGRAEVRAGGIFRAHGAGLHHRIRIARHLAPARADQPVPRYRPRHGRHRSLTGQARFTFGIPNLLDGIDITVVAVGLFAVGEALYVASRVDLRTAEIIPVKGSLWMTREEWARSWKPWLRGSFLGFPFGALPAGGTEIPTFLSYFLEKKLAKKPEEFGKGAIEASPAPKAANNSAVAGVLVPLLTLGLPTSADRRDPAGGIPAIRPAARPAAVHQPRHQPPWSGA
jgi:putative tricarboxylic transport membrane protein